MRIMAFEKKEEKSPLSGIWKNDQRLKVTDIE
jgi:hypothetical protein